MNEDKLKQDLNKSEKDKEIYKEKYREMKSKNSLMSSKIIEIESDLKTLMMDRESEFLVMKKTVENKKTNVDNTKHKVCINLIYSLLRKCKRGSIILKINFTKNDLITILRIFNFNF